MIQIGINPKAPPERSAPEPWHAAATSAEPSPEKKAELDPAGAEADPTFLVSPPPAPWPRVLPGL
jgi:hypothetical protein